MTRWTLLPVVSTILAIAIDPSPAQGQPVTEATDAVVLMTTYVDGRTVHDVVTRTPRTAWTPVFPKLSGSDSIAGEPPVTAIDANPTRFGRRTAISRGCERSARSGTREGTAGCNGGRRAWDTCHRRRPPQRGHCPVTLRLTSLSPTTLYPPRVLNRTAGLDAEYRVTAGTKPRLRSYCEKPIGAGGAEFPCGRVPGGPRALSANQAHRDASPVVAPNGTYSFGQTRPGKCRATPASGTRLPRQHRNRGSAVGGWHD